MAPVDQGTRPLGWWVPPTVSTLGFTAACPVVLLHVLSNTPGTQEREWVASGTFVALVFVAISFVEAGLIFLGWVVAAAPRRTRPGNVVLQAASVFYFIMASPYIYFGYRLATRTGQ